MEAGQIVRAMDAQNRYRFKDDQQVLGAWVSASTVRGKAVGSASAEPPGPAPTPEAGGSGFRRSSCASQLKKGWGPG